MAEDLSSSSSSYTEYETESDHDSWINDFHKEIPNNRLAKVPSFYVEDRFNLVGLNTMVKNIIRCYDVLIDKRHPKYIDQETTLYLLIHQRYIMTKSGMEKILQKVLDKEYGECKRILCNKAPIIPMGLSNKPNVSSVKSYCYNCNDLYEPKDSLQFLDGCAFGSSFPHFLVLNYKTQLQEREYHKFVPRIYGFRVYEEE